MKYRKLPPFDSDFRKLSESEREAFRTFVREQFIPAVKGYEDDVKHFSWPKSLRYEHLTATPGILRSHGRSQGSTDVQLSNMKPSKVTSSLFGAESAVTDGRVPQLSVAQGVALGFRLSVSIHEFVIHVVRLPTWTLFPLHRSAHQDRGRLREYWRTRGVIPYVPLLPQRF